MSLLKYLKHCRRLHYVSASLYCTGLLFALISCSIIESNSSTSFPFSKSIKHPAGLWHFVEISKDPLVYEKRDNDDREQFAVFLTAIKDCDIEQEDNSETAITRQLFVGLSKIQVRSQEELLFDEKRMIHWKLKALLDDEPVLLASYSLHEEKCVVDFVLWSSVDGINKESLASFDKTAKEFSTYLESIIAKIKV